METISDRVKLFLIGTAALLPLLGLAVLLWRRFYREDTGNTARRVLKNSALPIAANLINKVIDFGFAAITLRYLGVAGNGAYSFVALIVGLYFLTISNWGLNDLTVREVAADHNQAPRLFSVTLLLRWGIALLLAPAGAALVAFYAAIGNPLSAAAVAALALLIVHLLPAGVAAACSASFQAFQRMEVPALVSLLTNIAKVFVGVLALDLTPGVDGRVVALAAVALGVTLLNAAIFFALQQRMLFRFRFVWDGPQGRSLLRQSFPLLLNSLLLVVFFRFDYVILRAFGDDRSLGAYDAAYKWINMTTIIPAYFVAALFPVLARYAATDRPALLRAYRHAFALLQMIAWPVAVAMTVLAQELILLLGGRDYLPDAAVALAILIWFLPFSYANGVAQYVLIALRRQGAITVAFGIAAVFNLLANLALIPVFGYVAAALLTIATEIVIMLPFLRILRQEQTLLPMLALSWRPALAALAMGAAMLAAGRAGPLAAALVAPFVYGAMLWLLGAFGADERALVRRVLGRTG